MAVTVASREAFCIKCHERLFYTAGDVKKKSVEEKGVLANENGYATIFTTYELWYITCPSCGNTFEVDKWKIGSREVPGL